MDCDNCEHIGFSGNYKVCGWLLHGGEMCYVHNNKISEPCPKEIWDRYNKLIDKKDEE